MLNPGGACTWRTVNVRNLSSEKLRQLILQTDGTQLSARERDWRVTTSNEATSHAHLPLFAHPPGPPAEAINSLARSNDRLINHFNNDHIHSGHMYTGRKNKKKEQTARCVCVEKRHEKSSISLIPPPPLPSPPSPPPPAVIIGIQGPPAFS